MTGRRLQALKALRIGLVNHVVPHQELMEFAMQLARYMAAMDVEAGAATLLLHDEVLRTWQDDGLHTEGVHTAAKKTNLSIGVVGGATPRITPSQVD